MTHDRDGVLVDTWERQLRGVPCRVSLELRSESGTVIASRDSSTSHYAASTLKVAVLIAALSQADDGVLDLAEEVRVTDTFESTNGDTFRLRCTDDQDDLTWGQIGNRVPVATLLERMITESSNIATNLVLEVVGLDAVSRIATAAAAPELEMRRPIGDETAERSGITNQVSARGLATLWVTLARGDLLSPDSNLTALRLLHRQRHRDMIPAGVPSRIWVASKGGWTTAVKHDVALVRPPSTPGYVLAVCSSATTAYDARPLIAELSRVTWERWMSWHG